MSKIILSALGSVAIIISTAAQAASKASLSPPADHELLERALDTIKAQGAEIQALQARIDQLEKDRVPTLERERQVVSAPNKDIGRRTAAAQAGVKEPELAAINLACSVSPSTATYVVAAPKPFSEECLAPNREKKGRTVLDRNWNRWDSVHMGVAFLGSKEDSVATLTPTYTLRRIIPRRFQTLDKASRCDVNRDECGGYRSNYLTLKAGIKVPFDPDGKQATFADLTQFERASGVTYVAGLEWGDSRKTSHEDAIKGTNKALKEARNECIAEKRGEASPDPLVDANKTIGLRHDHDILTKCDGAGLMDWISADQKRREIYYGKLIKYPIYSDYSGDEDKSPPAHWFAGIEASHANSTYKFIQGSLQAEQSERHNLYSIKLYGGRGIGTQKLGGQAILEAADISASLTYRRDFTFPDGTANQDVCAPNGVLIKCTKKNLSAPIELKGFVAGGRIAGEFPKFGFLPETAIEIRGTYDLKVGRWGLEVPIYFVPNAKGSPSGGVMLSCTGSGHEQGQKLEHDCKGAIFVSTDFKLTQR